MACCCATMAGSSSWPPSRRRCPARPARGAAGREGRAADHPGGVRHGDGRDQTVHAHSRRAQARRLGVVPTAAAATEEVEMSDAAFHPVAELWPLLPEAELEALAEDIRENGLRPPIWRHRDGRII